MPVARASCKSSTANLEPWPAALWQLAAKYICQVLSSTGNDVEPGANGFRVSRPGSEGGHHHNSENGLLLHQHHLVDDYDRPSSTRSSSSGGGNGVGGGTSATGYQDSDEHGQPGSPGTVHGGTPLSQIGAHSVTDMYLGQGRKEPKGK